MTTPIALPNMRGAGPRDPLDDHLDQMFGLTRRRMETGPHVEVWREVAEDEGGRRYFRKHFKNLTHGDTQGDFRHWIDRESDLARNLWLKSRSVHTQRLWKLELLTDGTQVLETWDAGPTLEHWLNLPLARGGAPVPHLFHDCAHWFALVHSSLEALQHVHAVGFVHLDIKVDNVCVPPALGFDARPRQPLGVDLPGLKLIDYAFSLWPGEYPLRGRLGMDVSDTDRYQSDQLCFAIRESEAGRMEAIAGLDWRVDFYGLGWMLDSILVPVLANPGAPGWDAERAALARLLVRELMDYGQRWNTPAPSMPHASLIARVARTLAAPQLQDSLARKDWQIVRDADWKPRFGSVPRTIPAPSLRKPSSPPIASAAPRKGARTYLVPLAVVSLATMLGLGLYATSYLTQGGAGPAPPTRIAPVAATGPLAATPNPAPPRAAALAASIGVQAIAIGYAGPLSGPAQHVGRDAENGVRMAIDELNAARLVIAGKRTSFRLVSLDDQANPAKAAEAATRLCGTVVGVIGHFSAATTLAAARIYNACGVPHITVSVTDPSLTRLGYGTTFRMTADAAETGAAMARYASENLGVRRVAVIKDRGRGRNTANERFKEVARSHGMQVVAEPAVPERAADFRTLFLAIQAARVDAVFLGGEDTRDADVLTQLEQMGLGAKYLGGAGLCKPGGLARMGAADGAPATMYCAESGTPLGRLAGGLAWKTRYDGRFREQFRKYSPYTYDATLVLAEAMKSADSADPRVFLERMRRIEYRGVTGTISFDGQGQLRSPGITFYSYVHGQRREEGPKKMQR